MYGVSTKSKLLSDVLSDVLSDEVVLESIPTATALEIENAVKHGKFLGCFAARPSVAIYSWQGARYIVDLVS